MPTPLEFSYLYDRKWETADYSRTPLGIYNVLLCILRERFSIKISGQENKFNWAPLPVGTETDYKANELYIEKWGNINTKVSNFAPAIVIKRSAEQFASLMFGDKTDYELMTSAQLDMGQMTMGFSVMCYSRTEAEAEILSNLVHDLFIRCRWVIQKCFQLNMCQPMMLSEISVSEETQEADNRLFKSMVNLHIVFDYNHASVPISPRLKEISIALAATTVVGNELENVALVV